MKYLYLAVSIALLSLVASPLDAQTVESDAVLTHHDRVPRPCPASIATIHAVNTGQWNDPATWGENRVPNASDKVDITNHRVILSGTGEADCVEIGDSGGLLFDHTANTTLTVADIMVLPNGEFQIGSETDQIQPNIVAELIFKDKPLDLVNDPQQWNRGLIVFGDVYMHGNQRRPSFRFSSDPKAGDTVLQVVDPVLDWQPGDKVFIPDTRQHRRTGPPGDLFLPQWEEHTIAAASGTTITLAEPLARDHLGARDADGNEVADLKGHIANMSRNIVVRSQTPEEVGKTHYCTDADKLTGQPTDGTTSCVTRAHTAFLMHAHTDVRFTNFDQLGRTTTSDLNNANVDDNYQIINNEHGENQIARYPHHNHHLIGRPQSTAPAETCNEANQPGQFNPSACQSVLVGNSFTFGPDEHIFKWAITIHGSHYGLIKDNVIVNAAGAGIVTEDATETGNVFDGNFVGRVHGRGGRAANPVGSTFRKAPATEGTAIWFRGSLNHVRNNIAVNNKLFGFTYFLQYAGKVNFASEISPDGKGVFEIIVPAWQGATPSQNGIVKDVNAAPISQFHDNTVYGSDSGMTIWWIGAISNRPRPNATPSVFSNLSVWNVGLTGWLYYPSSQIVLDGFRAYGDINQLDNRYHTNNGITSGDYLTHKPVIKNSIIENMRYGWDSVLLADKEGDNTLESGTSVMENSTLRNYVNFLSATPRTVGGADNIPPKRTILRNITFGFPDASIVAPKNYTWEPYNVSVDHDEWANNYNVVVPNQTILESVNGNPDVNYEVFFTQSRPDYVMPETILHPSSGSLTNLLGCPEAGLTNTECSARWAYKDTDGTIFTGRNPIPRTNPDQPGVSIAGAISPCQSGDASSCPNALNSPQNDPQGLFTSLTNGDLFSTDTANDNGNAAPAININPDQTVFTVQVGDTLNFLVEAVATTGKTIQSLTAQNLPAGATFE